MSMKLLLQLKHTIISPLYKVYHNWTIETVAIISLINYRKSINLKLHQKNCTKKHKSKAASKNLY